MLELTQEMPDDRWEVEALFDLCFAPGREALSSYRLREDVAPVPELCLIARGDGAVGGAVRFWPILVGAKPALLLGPIAVHPTRQGEGVGADLMLTSLEKAETLGWQRVLLVGDAPYYGRFGFERLDDVVMPPPTNPARVLGRALVPGAWDGVKGDVARAGS